MKKQIICIVFTLLTLSLFCSTKPPDTQTYYNYSIPLYQLLPQPINPSGFSILVQKSSYTLFLKYNGQLIKSYPCVFGENPIEDKRMRGDMKTPEGSFFITEIREHYLWDSFIEIDYPNNESWMKHFDAKYNYEIPDSAAIGGDIGIHGIVDGWEQYIDNRENWTEGCVALKNKDVRELATFLTSGTLVKIVY